MSYRCVVGSSVWYVLSTKSKSSAVYGARDLTVRETGLLNDSLGLEALYWLLSYVK